MTEWTVQLAEEVEGHLERMLEGAGITQVHSSSKEKHKMFAVKFSQAGSVRRYYAIWVADGKGRMHEADKPMLELIAPEGQVFPAAALEKIAKFFLSADYVGPKKGLGGVHHYFVGVPLESLREHFAV